MRPTLAVCLNHPRLRAGPFERLPEFAQAETALYVVGGATMQPVLRAIAAGDLYEAVGIGSGPDLFTITRFFATMPERCRGSYARVCEWEMMGGLAGVSHLNESLGRVYP